MNCSFFFLTFSLSISSWAVIVIHVHFIIGLNVNLKLLNVHQIFLQFRCDKDDQVACSVTTSSRLAEECLVSGWDFLKKQTNKNIYLQYRQGRTTSTRALVIKPPPQKGGVIIDMNHRQTISELYFEPPHFNLMDSCDRGSRRSRSWNRLLNRDFR